MLKIGVIIISISVNKCCNHDKIAISPIFKMAAAAILDFEKTAIVGAWHHPDLISRGSEDSKTVLTSNTCFFKGVKSGFHLTRVVDIDITNTITMACDISFWASYAKIRHLV